MGLAKNIRVKSTKRIAEIYAENLSANKYPIRILYAHNQKETIRYAIVAPKRRFSRAVDRIKIKRLIREVARTEHTTNLERFVKTPLDVLVIYTGKEIEHLNKIRKSFNICMEKIYDQLQES